MSDSELLANYVRADQAAFAELVRRYVGVVYAAAVHHLHGDRDLAEDVVQEVFIDLGRKASSLLQHECLAGWLYTSTRFAAVNAIRRNARRVRREQELVAMDQTTAGDAEWARVRPVLDEGLEELSPRDRQFVILRFFGQRSFAEIGRQFAVSENAAQKAVDRALDTLGAALGRRGIASTAGALAVAMSRAGVVAPAGLQASVAAAVANAGALGASIAVVAAIKWTVAVLGAGAVAGVIGYRVGTERQLTADTMVAQHEAASHTAQIQRLEDKLRAESARATNAEADTSALLRAIANAKEERAQAAARHPPVAATAVNPPGTAYLVQPGDTLAKIAQAYGITPSDLVAANPRLNARRMTVGQMITLPPGAKLVDASGKQ